VEVRPCTLDDLRWAGDAFLTSTTRVVQPIVAVNDIEIPEGERTHEVGRALRQRIQEELGG
jgi:branched-subunit amino acid aminotransferase/4-amino-4-deoxychorismate lyase